MVIAPCLFKVCLYDSFGDSDFTCDLHMLLQGNSPGNVKNWKDLFVSISTISDQPARFVMPARRRRTREQREAVRDAQSVPELRCSRRTRAGPGNVWLRRCASAGGSGS